MWHIAICDDEQTVQQELAALWQKHFGTESYQLHCFSSGLELLQAAKTISGNVTAFLRRKITKRTALDDFCITSTAQ